MILNLHDKSKYVVHIRNSTIFILSMVLKLKKIHRAIKFEQEILKPYIEFNTEKRKNARNDFEKDIFKLLNNAVLVKQWKIKGSI